MGHLRKFSIAVVLLAAGSLRAAPAVPREAKPYRELLDRYCITCHSQKAKIAGVDLEEADLGDLRGGSAVWVKVIRKLRTKTMPPAGLPKPEERSAAAFVTWLESSIDRASLAQPDPGRTVAHRLNRTEYGNAIRDLFSLSIDPSLLPPDDSGSGFDNMADVLSVSPMLMERYLSAARRIVRTAIGDTTIRPGSEPFTIGKYLRQDDRAGEDLPFASRGGLAVRYAFPVDGEYAVKIFLSRTYDGLVRGLAEPHTLQVRLDGVKLKQFTVGGVPETEATSGNRRRASQVVQPDGFEVPFSAKAGTALVSVSFLKEAAALEGMLRPHYVISTYEYAGDVSVLPSIASVEIRGPYEVKGPGNSPSRQRIFSCYPESSAGEESCAKQILSSLSRRAYRRSVTEEDVSPLFALYRSAREKATFDAAIGLALRRLLVSPDFLFRLERDPDGIASGAVYRLGDFELASRLSFFLWSSIPDEDLLITAGKGRLRDPAVLEQQVRRMLADGKSQTLSTNFGRQWLHTRNIQFLSPDPYGFPDFDDNLRDAYSTELDLFVESQIREDRSVLDLLTANETFVNERLARQYGIPGVYGSHFRRVALPGDTRDGLLGKGGILMLTSYANRTSPVLRGKWLLEAILDTPPPPPPPNVPALGETISGSHPLSVRQRLEEHRKNSACAACHKNLDPLGFALENFDAVGAWRTKNEAGGPIDASGTLADGTKVDGPSSLRKALIAHPEDFAATVTRRLLTYAIGRATEPYDEPAVRRIVHQAAANNYRWSSIIIEIVKSTPFEMRRSEKR